MLSQLEVERLWNTIDLARGAQREGSGKACLMNMVAILAGEKQTDRPACACPALTAYLIHINDAAPDDCRQMLKPYAPAIIGTRDGHEKERRALFINAAVKFFAPLALERCGFHEHAAKLRGMKDGDWLAMKDAAATAAASASAAYAASASAAYAATAAASASAAYAATAAASASAASAAYAAYAASAYADAKQNIWRITIMPKVLELLDAAILIGAPERKAKTIIGIPAKRIAAEIGGKVF